MKKLIFTLLSLTIFLCATARQGYQVAYSEPSGSVMQIDFTIDQIGLETMIHDGTTYQAIQSDLQLVTQKEGWAELPFITTALQLKPDVDYDMKFLGGDYVEYALNHPLLPSRGVIYRNQNPDEIPYRIHPESIVDRFYPDEAMEMVDPFIIKDVRGTTVTVYPIRYNAVQNVLRVYSTMTIQLVENNNPPHNPLVNPVEVPLREMIGIYRSAFINYEVPDNLTIADHGEILVLTTPRDEAAIQPYIDWKREKGFVVHKEVVAVGTNVDGLVQTMYDANNNILYVLMIGDWADIKCANSGGTPQDPKTGCVVGNDNYFDIAIGRLSGNSAAQITTQVQKIINYEKEPDMSGSWYQTATGISSNQGPGDDGEYDDEHIQIIYDNKLSTFTYTGHNPIYDPSANSNMVLEALETGTGIINYTGHGSSTSWGSSGFNNNHISQLTNGDMLPFIFSVACVNGAYHSTTCFAEAWMNHQGGGAVAALMSTINQPWDPPMRGQDYFNDLIIGGYNYDLYPGQNGINTTEGRTTIGSIVFNGLVLMITESPGDLETANTWILFGDPSMQIRTAQPQALTYSNNVMLVGTPFETAVYKSGTPVQDALVAISQNGETISAHTNSTGTVSIPNNFLPGDVQIVITAFNGGTIYETIQCIPPTGPYVIYNDHEINDINGNNNGILEYFDGNVLLDFTMKNVGVQNANNVQVTISTTNQYVTVTDDFAGFGNISAGATATVSNAFAFDIAGDVPQGHPITFEVVAVAEDTWESTFTIVAYSALLEYDSFIIDDSNGNNNGILDPGETASLVVTIANNGAADAFNVAGTLQSLDSYVVVNTSDPQEFGDIPGNQNATAAFLVTAAASIPGGYVADLEVDFTADYGFAGSATFGLLFPDYCYGEASCSWGDGLTGFILGEINNMNNGCSNDNGIDGYGDFLDMTTQLDPGQTYTVTLQTGYSNQNVCLWIDFNDNKEFEADERLLNDFNLASADQPYTTVINIPEAAPDGQKRMRVRARWMNTAVDPCEDWSYGETEDYTVFIGEPVVLPEPENLSAEVQGNNVMLSWNAPPERYDMLGYNVYRDGELLASLVPDTWMMDMDCPEGSYWYAVTADYPEGESGHCSPVMVTIGGFIGKIQGFVRDAVTNQSISNAWVSALDAEYGAVTYQTPFGSHYSLSLPGGTYAIACNATGYQQAVVSSLTVVDDGVKTLNFYLYPEDMTDRNPLLTSIVDMDNEGLRMFPNPATDGVSLMTLKGSVVQIFNQTGQMVFQTTTESTEEHINLQRFEAGVYMVIIISGDHTYQRKLIVK